MENVNTTDQETTNEIISHPEGRVGNKLLSIFKAVPFIPIHKIIAESFFSNAETGILPVMVKENINFNTDGIYNVNRSRLVEICEIMEKIKAIYLTFTFVEIDTTNHRLQVTPYIQHTQSKMIYMIASLQTNNERTIDDNNYLLINSKENIGLENLKISDEDMEGFRSVFQCNGHKVWNTYFNKENTRTISYHIADLKETLQEDLSEKYTVHLCEISDVKKIIIDNNLGDELDEVLYNEFFALRERQITLVFTTDKGYYDMGSLRP
jgi:hypothetical protein